MSQLKELPVARTEIVWATKWNGIELWVHMIEKINWGRDKTFMQSSTETGKQCPSRKWSMPSLLVSGGFRVCPSEEYSVEHWGGWGGMGLLTMEKPDKYISAKWSRSTWTVLSHGDSMHPWYDVRRRLLYLWNPPPNTPQPCLIMRKTLDKS